MCVWFVTERLAKGNGVGFAGNPNMTFVVNLIPITLQRTRLTQKSAFPVCKYTVHSIFVNFYSTPRPAHAHTERLCTLDRPPVFVSGVMPRVTCTAAAQR